MRGNWHQTRRSNGNAGRVPAGYNPDFNWNSYAWAVDYDRWTGDKWFNRASGYDNVVCNEEGVKVETGRTRGLHLIFLSKKRPYA